MRILGAILAALALTVSFAPPVQAVETDAYCRTAEAFDTTSSGPMGRFCLKVWHSPDGLDVQRIDRIRLCKTDESGSNLDFADFYGVIRDEQNDLKWEVGTNRWTDPSGCKNWYPQERADAPAKVHFLLDVTWNISGDRYIERIWLYQDRLGTDLD